MRELKIKSAGRLTNIAAYPHSCIFISWVILKASTFCSATYSANASFDKMRPNSSWAVFAPKSLRHFVASEQKKQQPQLLQQFFLLSFFWLSSTCRKDVEGKSIYHPSICWTVSCPGRPTSFLQLCQELVTRVIQEEAKKSLFLCYFRAKSIDIFM